MSHIYIQQSAERPYQNKIPDPICGYMILVKNIVCPHGANCYRKSYSVTNYPKEFWYDHYSAYSSGR